MSHPFQNQREPGRTARLVAGWLVGVLLAAIVLHLVALPTKHNPELEADEDEPALEFDSEDEVSAGVSFKPPITQVAYPGESGPTAASDGSPLNAQRAESYLKSICKLGPRPSGSRGMKAQIRMVDQHFKQLGAEVELQRFKANNPLGGAKVRMTNVIARWNPEAKERLLLCAHYDTRPLPDRDPDRLARRQGVFLGANDGASGVALLMEMAHLLQDYNGPWGIDVVLFDGEELVYVDRRDPYFLGSQWFAIQYAKQSAKRDWEYSWAILFDMVGDADLQVHYERNSFAWPETRPLVKEVWQTAQRIGVTEFVPGVKHEVLDDHLALKKKAGIRAIDLIDFDYPHWHTQADTPDKCSGESLAKVGWLVWEWLLEERIPE